jgi:acyl-CoA synthetase (AMP-forming)/AMP-acid ligase II
VADAEPTWTAMVRAAQDHDRPAVRFGDLVWSGRELLDRAAGAADWLETLGLEPHVPVPALVSVSPGALALVIGGAGSAHPVAPLGVRTAAPEAAAAVAATAAPVLIAAPEHADLGAEAARLTGRRLALLPAFRPSPRHLGAAPDDIAVLLHTSGTTGAPKPVPMPQWRLAARASVNGTLCELDPESFYGASAPFHHISGLGNLAVALARGARITGIPRFTVEGWGLLRDLGVTHTSVVPSMLEMLLAAGRAAQPSLRVLQYGGAPIRPEALRQTYLALPGVRMLNMFGQTEGSPISVLTAQDHRDAVRDRPGLLLSVGRAAPGVELRVAEPDGGGVGEILARADHFFAVDAEGWLHSGDLGRVAGDGYVYLAGRRGDMIIRGGENVHPLEVETVIGGHPQVAEAAVVGVPDRRLGQSVAAYVVAADPAAPPAPEELRAYTRARLSGFKVPAEWHVVAELPRNANGKLLRHRLGPGGTVA